MFGGFAEKRQKNVPDCVLVVVFEFIVRFDGCRNFAGGGRKEKIMKRKMAGIGSTLALLAFAVVCAGQASQTSGEPRLADESGGYNFSAPAGWTRNRGEDGFSLVNPEKTILLVVRSHRYDTFEAAVRDTKLDGDTQVVGEPRDLKNGGKFVRLAKRTSEGLAVIDIFVLFSPNGGGVIVIGLSDEKNGETSLRAAATIAQSIAFTKPQVSAASSGWQSALAGKHLLYMYSGNGYFEEKHIYLCASGTVIQTTGSGGFSPGDSDGGSFAGRGGKRGNWEISGTRLVLRFQDGSVGEYNLSRRQASNEVGLNGNRYFVENQTVCK